MRHSVIASGQGGGGRGGLGAKDAPAALEQISAEHPHSEAGHSTAGRRHTKRGACHWGTGARHVPPPPLSIPRRSWTRPPSG